MKKKTLSTHPSLLTSMFPILLIAACGILPSCQQLSMLPWASTGGNGGTPVRPGPGAGPDLARSDGAGRRPSQGDSGPESQPGAPVPAIPERSAAHAGGTVIRIGTDAKHRANSLVLGTNRNHVAEYFPNGPAKLAKLRELRPTWGDKRYLYRVGHGITDGRIEYDYMTGFFFEEVWGRKGGYPYDDIRHALGEARELGAEQIHVVNFGTGSADQAARYAQYLNDAGSPLRKQYPFEGEPVRRFEIGNEISWTHARGHARFAPDESTYARRAKEFATRMRATSPVPIRIGAVATTNSNWLGDGWSGGARTVENILKTMGDQVDFLIFHGYPSWPLKKKGDLLTVMAQNAWNRRKLQDEIFPAIARHAAGRPVKVANTEFFTELYNDPDVSRGMLGALYTADTLATALDLDLEAAIQFCFEHGDMADSSFFRGNDPDRITPIFRVGRMLARHWGAEALPVDASNLKAVHVKGDATAIDMPLLGLAAARDEAGRVYALVVNRTNKEAVTAHLEFGFKPANVLGHRLSGPDGWRTRPDDVREESTTQEPGKPVRFPAASVTILVAEPAR